MTDYTLLDLTSINQGKLWSKSLGWVMAALIAHTIILPGKNSGLNFWDGLWLP
jgi:hypothetical protein